MWVFKAVDKKVKKGVLIHFTKKCSFGQLKKKSKKKKFEKNIFLIFFVFGQILNWIEEKKNFPVF